MIETVFIIFIVTNTAFWGFLAWDAWGRKGRNPFGVEPKEWRKAVKAVPYGKCKNCKCKHEWPNERCEA